MENIPIQKLKDNVIDTSKLNDYQRCPRFFFYTHVLGWRSVNPNNHLIFGSAWHEAMEHILLNGYEANSVIAAHEKFLAYYRQYLGPETDSMFFPKTPDNAFIALGKYVGHPEYKHDFDKADVLYTEIAGKVAIDDRHSLAFRMDSVLKDRKTEKIFSREHKTGSRLWMWDEQWPLAMQPGTYSHVLYCLYPFDQVDKIEMNGVFFLGRKKFNCDFHRCDIRKNKDQMQVWLNNVRYYAWEIEREYQILNDSSEENAVLQAFPLRTKNCLDFGRVCEFHDYCLAWPNPLRRCYEPPIGFKTQYWNPLEKEAKEVFNFEPKGY